MTYEKARDLLAMIKVEEPNELIVNSWWGSFAKDYKEALQMAIKALEREPCEDAISRQAVINAIYQNCIYENEYNLTASHIKELVQQIPSVTSKKKTGHWILTDVEGNRAWHCNCSDCGKDPQDYIGGSENWWMIKNKLPKYCSNCGKRMEVEE